MIAGHGRIEACRELGWSEIPTIAIEGLSEAKRKAQSADDRRQPAGR
jgi:ParB-like chromosome segregation protein Spo0J